MEIRRGCGYKRREKADGNLEIFLHLSLGTKNRWTEGVACGG